MRLDRLKLTNFRRFPSLELTLDPSFTLLVGENAGGKTSVLDAVACVLEQWIFGVDMTESTFRGLKPRDARFIRYRLNGSVFEELQSPCRVWAEGVIGGEKVDWGETLGAGGSAPDGPLAKLAEQVAKRIGAGQADKLPVLAYYRANRGWSDLRSEKAMRGVDRRLSGYRASMTPTVSHELFAEWLYYQTLIELQEQVPVVAKAAVEQAVCRVIGSVARFYFDVRQQEIFLQWQDGRVEPFLALSDGYRNMIAMVADLAWRAVTLNPALGQDAASLVEGVVLIDEIDQHLHPRWQRQVVADLRRAFPKVQFIATSHSPQVVASVKRSEIRLLGPDGLVDSEVFVEGRDSNSLLEDLFGVPERPAATQERIDALFRLLDDEQIAEATKLQAELEATLGPDDPAMIRARWILDREATLGDD